MHPENLNEISNLALIVILDIIYTWIGIHDTRHNSAFEINTRYCVIPA